MAIADTNDADHSKRSWYNFWDDDPDTDLYSVDINIDGTAPEGLTEYLETIEKNLEARPVAYSDDNSYLKYRYEQDMAYIKQAMEAQGYYKADIEAEFNDTEKRSTFLITPNAQYVFGKISIITHDNYEERDTALKIPDLTVISAQTSNPAKATTVLEDVATLKQWMEKHHCLFSYDVSHEAVLNHLEQRINITYRITAGKEAQFGHIQFKGSDSIDSEYLHKKISVEEGQCFKRSKVNDAQVSLKRLGLLANVSSDVANTPDSQGNVPVTFLVSDRAQRSIKAGTSFSTDIGFGVTAGWEHRNLYGQGEKLSTGISVTPIRSAINADFEKPYFLRDDQKLALSAKVEQQDNDAFTSRGITLSGNVQRDLGNDWLAGAGGTYAITRIDDLSSEQNVALLSFPFFISQDKRNDALNPTEGWTIRGDVEPFIDTIDSNTYFFKNQLQGTYYQAISSSEKSVLALRGATGNILGTSSNGVPATERYYTGGAGSIRGYAFQTAGPLDNNNDPLGGRSYIETTIELRFRVAEDYGLVTFIDGGNTYESAYPDFEDELLWGAGVGVRYYTDFGPLRADIAFPLDKRNIDDAFQLYFSIGQAF